MDRQSTVLLWESIHTRGLMETQIITNIRSYEFDFSEDFPSTDTIASTVVTCSPSGLTELTAKSSTSGLKRTLVIDAASATASTTYILGCKCTSASGLKHTHYKTIYVMADSTGEAAIATSIGANAYYSATLDQSGTGAPAAVVSVTTFSGTIVWTRQSVGTYVGTLTGAFPVNNTRVSCHMVPLLAGNESSASGNRINNDTVKVWVRDFADNLVDGFNVLHVDIQTYL
jgi:hypothetical protein